MTNTSIGISSGILTLPKGLDHESWWFGIEEVGGMVPGVTSRCSITVGQRVFVQSGRPDPGMPPPRRLGRRGTIGVPELIINRDTRDQYVIRSLIEEVDHVQPVGRASTTRDIAKRMLREGREPRDRSERMILNNYRTMQEIVPLKDEDLTPGFVFELQNMVTDGRPRRPDGIRDGFAASPTR